MQGPGQARRQNGRIAEAAREMIERSGAVLLDWDGCVATGNRLHPEAVRFIADRLDRVAVVSNNSTSLPQDFAAILAGAGVALPAERILLAGAETLARAAEIGARRVLILGNGRMKALGRNLGLELARDEADLVVLLRDTSFNYARLDRAVNSLRRGAKLLVANPDLTHPGLGGALVPETGALMAGLMSCMDGRPVDVEVVGKPFPRLFRRALATLPPADRCVMIGDNPATDIEGARAAGLDGLLIGPRGELGFEDLLDRPSPDLRTA